ncbi:MAG: hypothetical protein AAGI11_05365 [Pseudomonadota bacterium]
MRQQLKVLVTVAYAAIFLVLASTGALNARADSPAFAAQAHSTQLEIPVPEASE